MKTMPTQVLAEMAASISELKANPMKIVGSGDGSPVAILNRNEAAFYCIPAPTYVAMLDLLEDAELRAIVHQRQHEEAVPISLDEL